MSDDFLQKKKKKKRQTVTPELRRATLIRLIAMMKPWRLWLLAGNALTILNSAIGVVSLIAILPVLQIIFQVRTIVPEPPTPAQTQEAHSTPQEGGSAFFKRPGQFIKEKRVIAEKWLEERGRDKPIETITWVCVIFGCATLLAAALHYGASWCVLRVETEFLRDLMSRIYAHCVRQDLSFFSRHSPGTLMTHAYNDVNRIQTLLELTYVSRVRQPVTLLFLSGLLMTINLKLALITFCLVPILLLPAMGIVQGIRKLSRKEAAEDFVLMELLRERLSGVFLIKTHHAEAHEIRRFDSYARTIFQRRRQRSTLMELSDPLMDVLTALGLILVILGGIEVVLRRHLVQGETYLFFLIVLSRFYKPIKELTRTYASIQRPLMSAAAIFKILDEQPRILDSPTARPFPAPWRAITLEGVSFTYGSKLPDVLSNLNMTIHAGESLALVGHNGSGKSTLSLLLARFYDPKSGRILVDDLDLREIRLDDLRSKIAIIGQRSILFNLSVAENIAYGTSRERIDMQRVREAAERVGAHQFIETLPDKYATMIGHGSGRLSGGQRQLIAMARVFYKDAEIVIYDEPTVHLDTGTEASVMGVIAEMMESRTVILITHNEEHARLAKRIIRLDHGVIVQESEAAPA